MTSYTTKFLFVAALVAATTTTWIPFVQAENQLFILCEPGVGAQPNEANCADEREVLFEMMVDACTDTSSRRLEKITEFRAEVTRRRALKELEEEEEMVVTKEAIVATTGTDEVSDVLQDHKQGRRRLVNCANALPPFPTAGEIMAYCLVCDHQYYCSTGGRRRLEENDEQHDDTRELEFVEQQDETNINNVVEESSEPVRGMRGPKGHHRVRRHLDNGNGMDNDCKGSTAPSASPTATPTTSPTPSPTATPTTSPTKNPTASPTKAPDCSNFLSDELPPITEICTQEFKLLSSASTKCFGEENTAKCVSFYGVV